jgi:hypothetical protein
MFRLNRRLNLQVKLRFLQILYLALAGAIALYVQSFLFPLAGKKAVDNGAMYAYQLDRWSDEVYKRLESVSRTTPYDRIALTEKRTLTYEYANDVLGFHAQMLQILRVLQYQGRVLVRVSGEMTHLLANVSDKQTLAIGREAFIHLKSLLDEAAAQDRMRVELEKFDAEFRTAFTPSDGTKLNQQQKIDLSIRQLKILSALYTKPELLLRPNEEPLRFLQRFGTVQDSIFKSYSKLVNDHNRRVENEEFVRDLVLIALAMLTGALVLEKELSAWRASNQAI